MRVPKASLLALTLAMAVGAGNALAADAGAKAVDAAFTKAILMGDAAAVAACYADDAVLVMPGSAAIKGKKAIVEALGGFLGSDLGEPLRGMGALQHDDRPEGGRRSRDGDRHLLGCGDEAEGEVAVRLRPRRGRSARASAGEVT